MRAVISVIGKDAIGILARVSSICAKRSVNVNDVSQTILQDMFCMIMICDINSINVPFTDFVDEMSRLGQESGLSIHVMHEDIFNSMHSI